MVRNSFCECGKANAPFPIHHHSQANAAPFANASNTPAAEHGKRLRRSGPFDLGLETWRQKQVMVLKRQAAPTRKNRSNIKRRRRSNNNNIDDNNNNNFHKQTKKKNKKKKKKNNKKSNNNNNKNKNKKNNNKEHTTRKKTRNYIINNNHMTITHIITQTKTKATETAAMQPEIWEQWEKAENHKKAKENKQLERSTKNSAVSNHVFTCFLCAVLTASLPGPQRPVNCTSKSRLLSRKEYGPRRPRTHHKIEGL